MNENLGLLVNNAFAAIVQLATAMVNGWKLSLVILALTPVIFGCSALVTKVELKIILLSIQNFVQSLATSKVHSKEE